MPRRWGKAIAGLLALLCCLGGLAGSVGAQSAPATALQARVDPLFAELAALRGQAAPGAAPPIVVRSRGETRRYVEQELRRKHPAGELETDRKAMVAWGLIPPDFDLREFYLDLLAEQAAAYYDPVTRAMVLADWLTAEQQQAALVHELVHALQDRQVSLDAFLAPRRGRGDEQLARQALVEGEAVALSLEVLLKGQGLDLQQIPDLSGIQQLMQTQSAGRVYDRAPKFLRNLLLFPYTQGLGFVHQFRLRQPWAALGQLYQTPPRSTAQILHPKKFLDGREDPVAVTIPDLRAALAPAWRRVDEDELGEWVLGSVLQQHLDEATARRLAAGWRGDRYQLWEAGSTQCLIYRVAWQTEEAAETFARSYAGLLERKYPVLQGNAARLPGSWNWPDGPQRFVVEQRGVEVMVLERAPATAVEPIRQALWPGR